MPFIDYIFSRKYFNESLILNYWYSNYIRAKWSGIWFLLQATDFPLLQICPDQVWEALNLLFIEFWELPTSGQGV